MRNKPCRCGSGKRYKRCCGLPEKETPLADEELACAIVDRANLLLNDNKYLEALRLYREALDIYPEYARAHYNIGVVLNLLGKTEEAVNSYRKALKAEPGDVEAHYNLGNLLREQGELDGAVASYREALSLRPDYPEAHSNLLFTLNCLPHMPVATYLEEVRCYGRRTSGKVGGRFSEWRCAVKPERLRVGLVSGDLGEHPVGYFLENMLAEIDRTKMELVAYPTYNRDDALTARIRPRFSSWKPLQGKSDEEAAHLIHADGVHVLLDLSGHTRHKRLPVFAWKPAPVQATWLGYLASTGITEMDYIIADSVTVGESQQNHFTEKVWYLPETMFCFSPPLVCNAPATTLPALHNGYITFGSFQNLAKINDDVLTVWGRIFQELPQARLRIQNRMLEYPEIRDKLQRRLSLCGIAPERVTLVKATPRKEYFATHALIDIILDTFPYSGCTTICGALYMGVPTVTLAGETMLARQGASLLTWAGLSDWVALDVDEYVEKAVANSTDLEKLARLRNVLRQQVLASPLFAGQRFARNFEAAMWGMWSRWQGERSGG